MIRTWSALCASLTRWTSQYKYQPDPMYALGFAQTCRTCTMAQHLYTIDTHPVLGSAIYLSFSSAFKFRTGHGRTLVITRGPGNAQSSAGPC